MLGAPSRQTFGARRQTIAGRKYLLRVPQAGGDQILDLLQRGLDEFSVERSQRLSLSRPVQWGVALRCASTVIVRLGIQFFRQCSALVAVNNGN